MREKEPSSEDRRHYAARGSSVLTGSSCWFWKATGRRERPARGPRGIPPLVRNQAFKSPPKHLCEVRNRRFVVLWCETRPLNPAVLKVTVTSSTWAKHRWPNNRDVDNAFKLSYLPSFCALQHDIILWSDNIICWGGSHLLSTAINASNSLP